MIKKILLLICLFVIVAYQQRVSGIIPNTFTIDMTHEPFDSTFVADDDYYYSAVRMRTYEKFPKYEKHIKEIYKGIPENDSVEFYGCMMDNQFVFDVLESGDQTMANYAGIIAGEDLDTLNFSKVKLRSAIVAVIGFYKNKQFMVADANRNKNFDDDIKYEYDIDFRNNPYDHIDYIDKQPITEYKYESCTNGNIQMYNRRFVIYPDRNNPFCIDNKNPKKEREYFSILKFRDYWKGEKIINNKKIEFSFHGYDNDHGILYVKPKEIPFKRNDEGFNSQFKHYLRDTLIIAGDRYLIDSINRSISKVYLREIDKKNNPYGYATGDYIKNIEFKDLENESFEIYNISNKKKYTLLEFWGTWCGPCIQMTPKIIEAHQKFSPKLNIVSIAVDENRDVVKKYVREHKLDWKIGYIPKERSWENPIIKQLNVQFYPTFILINDKGEIIYRGSSATFDDIVQLIK